MTRSWVVCALGIAATVVTPRAQVPAAASRPLLIQDLFAGRVPKDNMGLEVSPDGRFVSYTLEDKRAKLATGTMPAQYTTTGTLSYMVGCSVWVVDTATGEATSLGAGDVSWDSAWSPDGRRLIFRSDRDGVERLWMWDRTTRAVRRVSDVITHGWGFDNLKWTPDGRFVVARVAREGWTPAAGTLASRRKTSATRVEVFRSPQSPAASGGMSGGEVIEAGRADIAMVDVETGRVRRVAGETLASGFELSPDGRFIVAVELLPRRPEERSYQPFFDVALVSTETGASRKLLTRVPIAGSRAVSWSPNSDRLAYVGSSQSSDSMVFIVSVDTGKTIEAALVDDGPLAGGFSAPLWNEDGSSLLVLGRRAVWQVDPRTGQGSQAALLAPHTPVAIVRGVNRRQVYSPDNGRSIVVLANDPSKLTSGFFRIGLQTGRVTPVVEAQKRIGLYVAEIGVVGQADHLFFIAEEAGEPPDVWVQVIDGQPMTRLTKINPALTGVVMGQQRLVTWTGRDGSSQRGLLLLPSGYTPGQPYPLIVHVYEQSMRLANTFGLAGGDFFNLQLFATRGFAVLYPDAQVFRHPNPLKRLADIVIPSIDKLVELGIADRERVGVVGHSSGGYAAAALAVQFPFKAAVVSAGVVDMFSFHGAPLNDDGTTQGLPWVETQMGIGGSPWEVRNRYIENSPLFFLDRVTAKTLILCGTDDPAGVIQMDQLFAGLQRLGKTAEYARYRDETHAEEWWTLPHKVDAAERMIGWFEKYLRGSS